jgi:hypothetical protein
MSESLIRESLADKERLRDRVDDANRFGRVESAYAVLQTRFDAWISRAVSGDDLKELKREMEEDVNKQVGAVCTHVDTKTEQQSKDLLVKVEAMFTQFQTKSTEAQLMQSNALLQANADTRREIIRYGVGFALTVLAALAIFWLTGRG